MAATQQHKSHPCSSQLQLPSAQGALDCGWSLLGAMDKQDSCWRSVNTRKCRSVAGSHLFYPKANLVNLIFCPELQLSSGCSCFMNYANVTKCALQRWKTPLLLERLFFPPLEFISFPPFLLLLQPVLEPPCRTHLPFPFNNWRFQALVLVSLRIPLNKRHIGDLQGTLSFWEFFWISLMYSNSVGLALIGLNW